MDRNPPELQGPMPYAAPTTNTRSPTHPTPTTIPPQIHEHILLYGDIRKKQKVNVAGQEMEVETMVHEEDDETQKVPTAKYANRDSFIIMRDRLKEKGFETRASLDGDPNGDAEANAAAGGKPGMEMGKMTGMGMGMGAGMGMATIDSGRVILAVPDVSDVLSRGGAGRG